MTVFFSAIQYRHIRAMTIFFQITGDSLAIFIIFYEIFFSFCLRHHKTHFPQFPYSAHQVGFVSIKQIKYYIKIVDALNTRTNRVPSVDKLNRNLFHHVVCCYINDIKTYEVIYLYIIVLCSLSHHRKIFFSNVSLFSEIFSLKRVYHSWPNLSTALLNSNSEHTELSKYTRF